MVLDTYDVETSVITELKTKNQAKRFMVSAARSPLTSEAARGDRRAIRNQNIFILRIRAGKERA